MAEQLERLGAALADRYAVERELGAGGMATVYLAEDLRHERKVAVKVLRPDLAAVLGAERFLREIKISASITHPNVLTLIDSGEAGGFLYYVMPYIEGESLRHRIARHGELPIGEAVVYLREVADALAHAHDQGIVHRDIKPDNVMISGRHALVMDFGVAKAVSEAQGDRPELTSSGAALGTPSYMSPEQASGDPDLDHRADIYALGVMAYEMLCGRPPFEGKSAQAVMAAQVTKTPEPVTKYRPTVASALNGLVMRCLEKNAADRWQGAGEIVAELELLATPSGGYTPTGTLAVGAEAMVQRSSPGRVIGLFAVSGVAVVIATYLLMVALGLPGWVLSAAIGVLILALPLIVMTAQAERRRAVAMATGAPTVVTEPGFRRMLNWRRAMMGGAGAFGLLGIIVAAFMGLRALGIGPAATLLSAGVLEERERIVLANFENHTTDSTLGETVTELFRIDLAQSPSVTVLAPAQVANVLARMEREPTALTSVLASEVAVREGIKAFVAGEIRSLGSGYVVSSRLMSANTGETLWADRESAAGPDGLVSAVDDLSASLRERIGESLRTIRGDAPLDRVTTRSTEALRKYAQANRANDLGDRERTIALLEQAIAADTAFAMAYRKLGIMLSNENTDADRAREVFTKAYEGRDRLTERERYLADAAYAAYVENDPQASMDAYEALLDEYPNDPIALNNLAIAYQHVERIEESEDLYLRSIRQGGAPSVTYTNAMGAQYRLGKVDSARATLEQFAQVFPENPSVHQLRAAVASSQFEYDSAEAHTRRLRETQRGQPTWEANAAFELANLAFARGRLREGRELWREAFRIQERNELGWVNQPIGYVEAQFDALFQLLYLDDADAAIDVLDRQLRQFDLRSLDPEDREYLQLADLYARAGRSQRARELLAAHEAEVDEESRAKGGEGRRVSEVLGTIAMSEGRFEDAVSEYRRARELQQDCQICTLIGLGEAFQSAGYADSAIAVFERYIDTPVLHRTGIDWSALWNAYRRLGELYEGNGNNARAADYYSRFADLWQDADAELQPMVEEARRRIARLVGEPTQSS